jgi:hypothetical protein
MRLLKLFEDFNNNQFKQIEDFENYLHKFSILGNWKIKDY